MKPVYMCIKYYKIHISFLFMAESSKTCHKVSTLLKQADYYGISHKKVYIS